MKKEKIITAAGVLLTIGFIILIMVYERYWHDETQTQINDCSEVISSSLWNLEPMAPTEYLTLLLRQNQYKQLTVSGMDGKAFIDLTSGLKGPLDRLLNSLGLIRPHRFETDVLHTGKTIGRIYATRYCTSVYVYFYVLLLMMLGITLLWYYLRTVEAKRGLEALVEARTIQLEEMNQALKESEIKFRSIYDQSPIGIELYDSKGNLIDANPKRLNIFGISDVAAVRGFKLFEDPNISDEVKKRILAGEAVSYESEFDFDKVRELKLYETSNTGKMFVDVSVTPWKTGDSGEESFLIHVIDTTDRKRAEETLKDSERSLATLMSNLPGMAYRCKNYKNWTMEFVSNGSYGLTGYHPSDLINNKKIAYGELIHTEDREQVWKTVQLALSKKESFQCTYRISNIAGEEKWVSEKGCGIFSPDGELQALEGFISDITDRKQAEEELEKHREHLEELVEDRTDELKEKTDKIEESRKALTYLVEDVNEARKNLENANEKLKELDRLKSMFIASMSHELRTPLNSIIGFTGIILQGMTGEINAEQKDQLQRVSGSAKHLLNLITDIIDISKIEAGKVEVYAEEVNLNAVIKEAVSSLKPEIENKGIDLETSLPLDLQLTTDRKRLLQCILNYLSNAVKFTEKGKIKISAHEIDGMMEIKVKDTGIGIKEEDIPRLFKSFVRLDTPLKAIIPGTGLGLYLTKKLATEVLKGSVLVESVYGEGSTFGLTIPREI